MKIAFQRLWRCLLINGLILSAMSGESKSIKVAESDNVTITQLVKLCCSDDEVFDITTQKCINLNGTNLADESKMDVLSQLINTKGKDVITNTIERKIWDQEKYKIAYKYQTDPRSKVKLGKNKLIVQRLYSEYFRCVRLYK